MAEDETNKPENGGENGTGTPETTGADQNAGQSSGEGTDEVALNELPSGLDVKADEDEEPRTAQDLEPVFDVPVKIQAVLGRTVLEVNQLLKLGPGAVLELDRKVGEAIDIYVNNRLVARGEVVLVDEHLGVTMTEIIKSDH
ncbi:MAG: flagellar motor switch protein FliN [Alphaproteobacteria bacterium]|nr:MAG: flagellar motor switch protein FliN [Alphaproteobacteria bacterium]